MVSLIHTKIYEWIFQQNLNKRGKQFVHLYFVYEKHQKKILKKTQMILKQKR